MKLKRLWAIALVTALLISSVGCVELDQNGNPIPPAAPPPPPPTESQRFDQYLTEQFNEVAGDNLLDNRFLIRDNAGFGITDVSNTMGSIDFEEIDNAAARWQEDYDELTAFKYSELTEEQKFLHTLLKHDMDEFKPVVDMGYYEELNSPLLGTQTQLPSLLAEFPLYTVQDVYSYVEMLASMPDYFGDMEEYQRRRSAKGLFMSDTTADSTIKSCQSFIESPEKNLLLTTFAGRLEKLPELTEEQKTELHALNQKAVTESVIPAYESLIATLESLKGTGKNDQGLWNLPGGKQYYEYLAKSSTGSERSVKQMAELLDDGIEGMMLQIYLIQQADNTAVKRMVNLQYPTGTPEEQLEELRQQCRVQFPPLQDLQYTVKAVDKSLEEQTSPAFYIIPQVDTQGGNIIYINEKYYENSSNIFATLAHEGYPGHMYMFNYQLSSNPPPIRRLMSYKGYSEGWASYVEMLSYGMMGTDDPVAERLAAINENLGLLISCRADIGINYDGWSKEELEEYLAEFFETNDEMVEQTYWSVIEDPANYLSYGVGALEFFELRSYAKEHLGDSFDPLEFHRVVLDVGSAPFEYVRTAVETHVRAVERAASESAASESAASESAASDSQPVTKAA